MKKLSLIIIFLPLITYGDSPPDWPEYRVCGDGKWFCADIGVASGNFGVADHDSIFVLKMLDMRGTLPRVIWQREYDHPGYGGGFVTTDGKYFVYVDQWYYADKPVVLVHHEAGVTAVNGDRFLIRHSALQRTASHYLWLEFTGSQPFATLRGHELILRLIDGRTRKVDIETGAITPVLPDPEKQGIWQKRD